MNYNNSILPSNISFASNPIPTYSTIMEADGTGEISMENLYPALIQCFSIILVGYVAGRLNIITNAGTKGFNSYVGNFALPSVIFLSLSTIDWSTVNWKFLLAIMISKSIAFFSVMLITLLVVRPLNYGKSGILAIFCTQSNDFAIGYPIVEALYKNVHPEYAAYIYLVAPISLAILNPIAYVLMEITNLQNKNSEQAAQHSSIHCQEASPRSTDETSERKKKILVVVKTVKSIFFNPILLMTLLGILGKFVFPSGLPTYISSILQVLANSFAGTALFLLGVRMVGKAHNWQGSGFLLPGILIIVKLLVLPLIIRQTINIIHVGNNFNETTDLSTFGFLYGTFPSAPGVFVISLQYNTETDLIASAMVACTFISAPLMFISAKMISITKLTPNDYLNELDKFGFDISIASIVAVIFILMLFVVTKKFKRMPHRITCCLLIAQLIGSIGVILWSKLGQDDWKMYLQFCFFTVGQWSSRLFTAYLALTLVFLNSRSLCFVLKLWPYFLVSGFGIPVIFAGILLIFDRDNLLPKTKQSPNFQFGKGQAGISAFLLVLCFVITVGSLVIYTRNKKRFERYMSLTKDISSDSETVTTSTSTANLSQMNGSLPRVNSDVNFSIHTRKIRRRHSSSEDEENQSCHTDNCCNRDSSTTATTVVDIEDLLAKSGGDQNGLCPTSRDCAGTSRDNCQSLVQRYQEQSQYELEPLEVEETDLYQTLKHTVLLVLLLCSMFVNLALTAWTLIMDGMSGIYVELAFLDAFLNFGQALIVAACFISDTGDILMPLIKLWRKFWYGANTLKLPNWEDVSADTKHVCDQFKTYHLEACRKAIAKDERWRIKIYKKVFYGDVFIDWLIEVGLARDRAEGLRYGRKLVEGRVLKHINNVYHFNDRKLLYTFCSRL